MFVGHCALAGTGPSVGVAVWASSMFDGSAGISVGAIEGESTSGVDVASGPAGNASAAGVDDGVEAAAASGAAAVCPVP